MKGLEPPSQFPATLAFQASLLPLEYTAISAVDRIRTYIPFLAGGFQDRCSTNWATTAYCPCKIRTYECRDQNPVPYRLANGQCFLTTKKGCNNLGCYTLSPKNSTLGETFLRVSKKGCSWTFVNRSTANRPALASLRTSLWNSTNYESVHFNFILSY